MPCMQSMPRLNAPHILVLSREHLQPRVQYWLFLFRQIIEHQTENALRNTDVPHLRLNSVNLLRVLFTIVGKLRGKHGVDD